MNKKLLKFIVPILAFFFSIICFEFILSFFYPRNEYYYISKPKQTNSFPLNTKILRGVSDTSNTHYNSFGARSDEVSPTHYKIIAFGGSTTECMAIDQKKTWTELLQTSLNKNNDSIAYWVGNFGKSGNETNHHILQTEEMLKHKELENAEILLYLTGFNDLIRAIEFEERYINPDSFETRISAFTVVPDKNLPFYRRTSVWKFLKNFKHQLNLKRHSKEQLDKLYQESRKRRKKIKKDSILPNLNKGVEHYKKNINTLIKISRAKGKKLIFLTQPVLWRPKITEESENILYSFFKDINYNNLDTKSLYKCMKVFNNALIEVCIKNEVQYIDLFKYSKESWFYDDCHFNEKGAREVAKIIYSNIVFNK